MQKDSISKVVENFTQAEMTRATVVKEEPVKERENNSFGLN